MTEEDLAQAIWDLRWHCPELTEEQAKQEVLLNIEGEGFDAFMRFLRNEMPGIGENEVRSLPVPSSEYCGLCVGPATVAWAIVHLNDQHQFSREAIADWLEWQSERDGFSIEFPMPKELS